MSISTFSDSMGVSSHTSLPHHIAHPNLIHHPENISIHCQRLDQVCDKNPIHLCNSPHLNFSSQIAFKNNTRLRITLKIQNNTHDFHAVVTHSQAHLTGFHIRVGFESYHEAFRLRMIEQICHIETYREELYQQQGRRLCYENAAQEWIERYADTFPTLTE